MTGLGAVFRPQLPPERLRAIARPAEAGADTVVLQPTADEPDPEAFIRFAAREVRPLVP